MITSKLHELYLKSNGVSTDTRKITKNSIFFSLKGKNFDGNEYALEALNNGAKYAVIDNKNLNNPNFIKVNNVLESLQKLSLFHRTKLINTIFIAITGSNGKTTTKELVHSVLSQKYKAKSTHGNLNNHIGVPLTLLNIKEDTDFAVVEMGANHIGEIKFLTNLIKPDLGYITNFGKAHLEGFGGFEGVIKGKSELYDWLLENKKPILINTNDKIQSDYINSKSITFGLNNNSKYIFKKDDSENFVLLNYNNIKIKSNLIGDYNLNNIGAAVSLGLHFKLDIKSIKKAIQNYTPNNNRSQLLNIKDKKIMLDAYNANPTSMQLAIESFIKLSGKKILILGDMFELGLYTKEEHLKLIKQLEKINIKTYFVGKEFYKLKKQSNMFSFFKTKKDVTTKISKNRIREKNILIKGSRGLKMETILDYIK